jgi:hypothetical protein
VKSLSLYQGNSSSVYSLSFGVHRGARIMPQFVMQTVEASKSTPPNRYLLSAICYLLLAICYSLFAQTLSKEAKVSLITVSPGQELYSSFGHNALWVSDPVQGIDRVYNYGTFDFRTEGFYLKFIRGTLPYQLSVSPMYYTVYGAQAENRSVTEQILNLSLSQKQKLYDFLENNYLPENRQYAYKFFYDNCATRLRDALKAACGDSLVYSTEPISKAQSYRDWMNDYLDAKSWARFGMNLAIGLPSDHIATPQEEMYLPNNLRSHLDSAKIGGKRLVLITNPLFEARDTTSDRRSLIEMITGPNTLVLVLMIFLFQITNYQKKREKISYRFDKILFGILGLIGWFLLLLGVATDHGVTNWNIHLLWAVPFHLPLMLFLGNPKHRDWMRKYLLFCLGLLGLFVVVVIVGGFVLGTFICQPEEIVFLVFGLFSRLYFLQKRV